MDNLFGKTLGGRYRILEFIGEGGMAEVYKALDINLDRIVALKIIGQKWKHSSKFNARFNREARTLAQLSHPNILKIFDCGEFDGLLYLVTEYISGGTLKEMLKGKPISWQRAAQILAPLAYALEAAHIQGIIHRDVKPSNILMTDGRNPMLSDFGIAKIIESNGESADLTGTGMGIGTPEYMAPEQATSKSIDYRVDIYALGVVLYQMVTGQVPFKGDTPLAVMLLKNTEPLPPPRQYVPSLPADVEKVIVKALARKPEERYQNINQFAKALDILANDSRSEKDDTDLRTSTEVTYEIMVDKTSGSETKTWLTREEIRSPDRRIWLFILASGVVVLCVSSLFVVVPNLISDLLTPTVTPTHTSTSTPRPTRTPVFTPTSSVLLDEIKDEKGALMRLVPAGEFTMGSNDYGNEMPIRQVYLNAYYIDKYEVTNLHYNACVDDGECSAPIDIGSITESSYFRNPQYANYPVTSVNWLQAKAFCEWRGARLPTEAEWEKAARGEDGLIYPWGNSLKCENGNFDDETQMDNYLAARKNCDGYARTSPVGVFEGGKSPYDVYDLIGNVWEWVADWYDLDYYVNAPNEDPQGPTFGDVRVVRGGSWDDKQKYLRSSARGGGDPSHVSLDLGFRCAHPIP